MGVAAPTGLHPADLHRTGEIGNVEDAQAPKPLGADLARRALQPAIDAPASLLNAHHQQVASHRDIALPAGAHDTAHQIGHAVIAQLVDVEPVVRACDHHIAKKRDVGVGEVEQRRTLGKFGQAVFGRAFGRGFGDGLGRVLLAFLGCSRRTPTRWVGRVKEPGGLGQRGDFGEIQDRFASIVEPGSKARTRVCRQASQQLVHPLDLAGLFVFDIADEAEQYRVSRGAIFIEQLFHHLHRAFVVGDHQGEELPVKLHALGRGQRLHLFGGGHACHGHVGMVTVVALHHRVFGRLPAFSQPAFHEGDFVSLARFDPSGNRHQFCGIGAILDQHRHVHCLLMMHDHVLHEDHVGRRVGGCRQRARLIGGQRAGRLPRRTGLHNRRTLRKGDARGRQHHCGKNSAGGAQRGGVGHDVPLVESVAARLPRSPVQSSPCPHRQAPIRRTCHCGRGAANRACSLPCRDLRTIHRTG